MGRIGIISSKMDIASHNMAQGLLKKEEIKSVKKEGVELYKCSNFDLLVLEGPLIEAQIDKFGFDVAYFLSKHKSKDQVPSFTTHSLGNFREEAKLGGKPKELGFAAPIQMLGILQGLEKIEAPIQKTYEATHHGPLLKTPSLFVELGGDEKTINNAHLAGLLSDIVYEKIISRNEAEYDKVALGIGCTHYPEKFNRLAFEGKYAFSHIMPKYAILNEDGTDNLAVLSQALERSNLAPEIAVVDWKSINAVAKNRVVEALNRLGLDYEKV